MIFLENQPCGRGDRETWPSSSLQISFSFRQTCCYDMELLYYFLSHVEIERGDESALGWGGGSFQTSRSEFMFVYMVFPQLNDCINENHVEIISSY